MMEPLVKLKELATRTFTDKAGKRHCVNLLPGLADEQLDEFKQFLRHRDLPAGVEELLRTSVGFTFYEELLSVRFDGIPGVELLPLFPFCLPVASDVAGNYWCVEIDEAGVWEGVYYVCRSPRVMVLQSENLAAFLEDINDFGQKWEDSRLDKVHSRRIYEVVRDNEGVLDYSSAVNAADGTLREFAAGFPPSVCFADLRGKTGMAGINLEYVTEMRKHPTQLLWALTLERPEKGWIKRLFKL